MLVSRERGDKLLGRHVARMRRALRHELQDTGAALEGAVTDQMHNRRLVFLDGALELLDGRLCDDRSVERQSLFRQRS
jgi:hypothetical protein